MSDYLRDHPMVLATILAAALMVAFMAVRSFVSWRFLRSLRHDAPEFWAAKVGSSIGVARIFGLTPGHVSKSTDDPHVRHLCARFERPMKLCFIVALVMFALAVTLMIASTAR